MDFSRSTNLAKTSVLSTLPTNHVAHRYFNLRYYVTASLAYEPNVSLWHLERHLPLEKKLSQRPLRFEEASR